MKIILLLLVCGLVLVYADYNFEEVIEKVPEDERVEFIKHHIQIGYELTEQALKYELPEDLPDSFSMQLYKYMLNRGKIDDPSTLKHLFEIVCFPNGSCIDVGDIGVHPRTIKV